MRTDFKIHELLDKPLILNLASICPDGPRDSVLWFLYEDQKVWLLEDDGFVEVAKLMLEADAELRRKK